MMLARKENRDRARYRELSSRGSLPRRTPHSSWRQAAARVLLQILHELGLAERKSGVGCLAEAPAFVLERRPPEHVSPIAAPPDLPPTGEVHEPCRIPAAQVRPRARPRILFATSGQAGSDRVGGWSNEDMRTVLPPLSVDRTRERPYRTRVTLISRRLTRC